MNKTKHNKQTRLNCAERILYLNEITQIKAECARELAAKDEIIAYYQRAAEAATRSKHRAIARKEERRKDVIAWGIFILFIVAAMILAILAGHEFLLWASGR